MSLQTFIEQTSLIGQVRTEVNCQPVENEEYQRISSQRALLALRPRQKTKLLDNTVSGNILKPGTMGTTGNLSNFVVRPYMRADKVDADQIRTRLHPQDVKVNFLRALGNRKMSCWMNCISVLLSFSSGHSKLLRMRPSSPRPT